MNMTNINAEYIFDNDKRILYIDDIEIPYDVLTTYEPQYYPVGIKRVIAII